MVTEIKKVFDIVESLDWIITKEGDNSYMLSKMALDGYDFNIIIEGTNIDELINSIWVNYENYDPSYETYLWLDNEGHGKNGAPYDMGDVYNTMKWCEQSLHDLYYSL